MKEPEEATVEDIIAALSKAPQSDANILFRVWNDDTEQYESELRPLSGIEVNLITDDANVIITIGGKY